MNKVLGTLFLAFLLSGLCWGCAPITVNGQRHRVFMPQVGLVVTVQNNCAANLVVETMYGTHPDLVSFGQSTTIPVPSRPFSGNNREVWVMVKAYDAATHYLGSAELREYVDVYNGTQDRLWQVDGLASPSGARCKTP